MSNPLNPRHLSHRALCALLIALTIAGPGVARAQQPDKPADAAPADEGDLNLKYVTSDACFVLALRPAQVLTSPNAELLPTEVLQAALMKELGVDPLNLEQIVVSVSPPTIGPPRFSLFVKSSDSLKLKEGQVTARTRAATLDGKQYLQSTEAMGPSFFWPDEQSLLVAPEYAMKQLAAGQSASAGSLPATFAAAAQGDDLFAMFDMAPLRNLIDIALAQAPVPPELAPVKEIHRLVKTIELRLNLVSAGKTELVITANNEADAEKLLKTFDELKQIGLAAIERDMARDFADDDPVNQAMLRYQKRTMRYMYDQFQITRDGSRLIAFSIDGAATPENQLTRVAVVGILVGLLLPAVQAAREAARRSQSMNNLKNIMLGLLNYESARRGFPAQANYGPDGKPLLSWRVHILPYLEQQALYEQFHLDEPWDSAHNKALVSQMPELYLDPSSGMTAAEGRTHYLGSAGAGRLFDATDKEGRQLKSITDGMSNTIAVVQVDNNHAVEWTKPEDWEMDANNPAAGLGALHAGVFLAAFCDGHIQAVSEQVDPALLKALSTVAGGEPASP